VAWADPKTDCGIVDFGVKRDVRLPPWLLDAAGSDIEGSERIDPGQERPDFAAVANIRKPVARTA